MHLEEVSWTPADRWCDATNRDRPQLTTFESFDLIDEAVVAGAERLHIYVSDPQRRGDLGKLIAYARKAGITTIIEGESAECFDEQTLAAFARAGAHAVIVPLHHVDELQRVENVVQTIRRFGMEAEITSTFTLLNIDDLAAMALLIETMQATLWIVRFGSFEGPTAENHLTPELIEEAFSLLYRSMRDTAIKISTPDAPHFKRYVMQRLSWNPLRTRDDRCNVAMPTAKESQSEHAHLHVDCDGAIRPDRDFSMSTGNIRDLPLDVIFREAPLLVQLRDPRALHGRCGVCEFKRICGGYRPRAFAHTHDPLDEDPACTYKPATKPLGVAHV